MASKTLRIATSSYHIGHSIAPMVALEKRLRAAGPSEDERALRMFTSPQKIETMPLPLNGQVPLKSLEFIGEEMKLAGELPSNFSVQAALKDETVKQAFADLLGRNELKSRWDRLGEVVVRHGC